MSDYFIQSINNAVYVSRIINSELETIKINGEAKLKLADFWVRFKQKIEYDKGEELAFVVLKDDNLFCIDSEIAIADMFVTPINELQNLILDHLKASISYLTFPDVAIDISEIKLPPVIEHKPIEPIVNNGSIESFYRKKTREYNRNNIKSHVGK